MDAKIAQQIKPGAQVRVWERVPAEKNSGGGKGKKGKENTKERISRFQGIVLARKHGQETGATFTVRSIVDGVGMEKVYPLQSPMISKVEILSSPKKVHRAKLYFVRGLSKKKSREKIGVAA